MLERYGCGLVVFFLPKMSPNGRGFESLSEQITIFPIKFTRNVKLKQNTVKSTKTVIERDRRDMTIYIDSTSQKREFYAIVL
jgi:hypothetical protein